MTLNFNVDPYYDDFDETKGFHKILFKPGLALQARELTQIQSLLQNQISKFGDSVYREGSVVTGGEHFLDDSVYYIKVVIPSVDVTSIEGKYIKEVSDTYGTRWALVKKYTAATNTDSATLHVTIVSGKIGSFVDGSSLDVYSAIGDETSLYTLTAVSLSSSGAALLFHINQGVFYSKGSFVFCPAQTAVVGKYSKTGSGVIGLSVVESIISSDVDDTLLDPAFGSYNYAAPGADRYMISLELTVKEYSELSQAHEDFIELVHVREGVLLSDKRLPIYSNIGDTMARRTYDESGDYIVKPFIPKITQDQNDAIIGTIVSIQSDTEATLSSNSIISFTGLRLTRERGSVSYNLNGTVSVSNDYQNKIIGVGTSFASELVVGDVIKTGAESNLILEISPGKAYVRGYELETNGPTNVRLNKARSTKIDTEQEIATYYGNYTLVSSITGSLPSINTGVQVDLHSSTTVTSSTVIGKAQVINLDYVSGTDVSAVYAIVLESLMLSGSTFDNVKAFAISTDSYSTTTFKAVVDSSAIASGKTSLYDSNYTSLLYNVPPSNIKSISSVEYHYRKKFSGITVTAGIATISTDSSNDRFTPSASSTQYRENFVVVVKTKSAGTFSTGEYIPLDSETRTVTITAVSGSPGQAVIDLNDNTFMGTVDIIASIRTSESNQVAKTLVESYAKEITIKANAKTSLETSDIYKLNKVYELDDLDSYQGTWSSSTTYAPNNVVLLNNIAYRATQSGTNKSPDSETDYWDIITDVSQYYILDNGQTDSHYDHGSITRTSQLSSDVQAIVLFDYFTHAGTGYISSSSYPIDYGLIPSYTNSKGITYRLRDTIDFRPRRVDGSSSLEYSTFIVPKLSESIIATVEYYLQKVDRVVMTREGNIKVLEGIPAVVRPVPPSSQEDSMTLYLLTYSAYTDSEKDVSVEVVPNRRYTMKDIGAIDNRVKNIEYYTALSLVENNVNNQTFTDSSGLPLFKNGYLVDSFKGHDVGDVENPEYNCSIDSENGELRPPFDMRSINFRRDETTTIANSTTSSNGIMTIPYTESTFINQNVASSSISVNPFDVVAFSGTLKISPESDTWVDINSAPDIVENVGGLNDNFASFQSLGTTWNSWETIFGGTEKEVGTKTTTENGYSVTRATYDIFENRRGRGVETLVAPPSQVQSTSTKTISKSVIPYARAKDILFQVSGMTPNVELFLYIDGKHMSNYLIDNSFTGTEVVSSGILPKTSVTTDASGYASGTIHFPSNSNTKFLSGKHTLSLCDNQLDPTLATCWAEVPYTSEGVLQTDQKTFVTTRGGYQVTRNVEKTELFKVRTEERIISKVPVYTGPNANYSLTVDQSTVREGGKVTFTLTAKNAPVNRVYTGTLSGSGTLTNSDISGATLGSVYLTTKGTLSSNTATLPISIVLDALTEGDETINLSVDIPADSSHPEWGGPLTLTASSVITNAVPASYTVTTPSRVNEGDTISVVISGSSLTASTAISYSVTGTCTEYTGSSSGTVTLQSSNSYSQTLSFPISGTAVTGDPETFIITFTLPSGQTISKTVMVYDTTVIPTPTYSLSNDTTNNSIVAGGTVVVTLTTTNVSNGTLIPYTITGVTSSNISTPLTGNFTVSGGSATLSIVTNTGLTETFKPLSITLDGKNVSSMFAITQDVTVPAPTYKIQFRLTNSTGPIQTNFNEGDLVWGELITTNVPDGTMIPCVFSGTGVEAADFEYGSMAFSVPIKSNYYGAPFRINPDSFTEGKESVHFSILDGVASSMFVINDTSTSVANPTYAVSGPATMLEGEWAEFTITTTGVPAGTQINGTASWILDAGSVTPNGYWERYNYTTSSWEPVPNITDSFYVIVGSGGLAKFRVKGTENLNAVNKGTYSVTSTTSSYDPIGNTNTVYIPVSPSTKAASKYTDKITKIGDFVDSSLTIAEAIAKYSDTSDGFNTHSRSASDLSQFGSSVKSSYVNTCNRNPDVAGWIYWMGKLCEQVTTKSSSFTSVDLYVNQNIYNDSHFTGYGGASWINFGSFGTKSGVTKLAWNKTYTTYRNVTLTPGTYSISTRNGAGAFSVTIYDSYNGNVINKVDSNKDYNNVATIATTINVIIKIEYNYAYTTDGGWGFKYKIYKGATVSGGTLHYDLASNLTGESITTGVSTTPMTVGEAGAALAQSFVDYATRNNDLKANRPSFVACTTDPLAESFFVAEATYPNGVFVSAVDLYFKSKDKSIPIWAEIRPNVNGYPSSDVRVPGTTVYLNPNNVNISDTASAATTFKFEYPIFLKPGEYSIVTGSNSSKYYAYISEMGQKQLGTNAIISKQPYVGSLFKSQNASTWTAAQEQDLMFKLYQCKFDTTQSYDMVFSNVYDSNEFTTFEFDTFKLNSTEIDFGEKTDIVYQIANTNNGVGSTIDTFSPISANKNTTLTHRKQIDSVGDTKLKITMKTNDNNISPVVDTQRLSGYIIENLISKSSDLTVPEETPYGGNAYAKYVTRNLTLAEGFDATGLRIILDVNRPQGTSIKVYAKVLSADDGDQFDYKSYQEIPLVAKPQYYSNSDSDFLIDEYKNDAITYNSSAGVQTTFRTFSVKIVMFSDDPVRIPKIRNLRAIATS